MNKECKYESCTRYVSTKSAKGFCTMHYKRYRTHGDPSIQYPLKSCRDCQAMFTQKAGNSVRCRNCHIEYSRSKQKQRALEKIMTKEKKCKTCEKSFFGSGTKFCSRTCFFVDSKKSREGKNNPAYRTGSYSKAADKNKINVRQRLFLKHAKELKESIIQKHGYLICQHCGVNESQRFECHHLIFRSEKPKHQHLHDKSNLLYCCIKCHNLFHKNKHSMRARYIEQRGLVDLFGNDILATHKQNYLGRKAPTASQSKTNKSTTIK